MNTRLFAIPVGPFSFFPNNAAVPAIGCSLRHTQHIRTISERMQRRLAQPNVDDEAVPTAVTRTRRRPHQQKGVRLPGSKLGPPAAAVTPLRSGVDPTGNELDEGISQLEQVMAQ